MKQINNQLKQGICEVTWTDSYGVEHKTSGTLSTIHLNDDYENPYPKGNHVVSMWDVVEEEWIEIPNIRIVDCERLTGIGVKDDVDKVNIDTMEEFLYDDYYRGEEKPSWM
mgnify:CR=1 FL=1